MNYLRDSDLTQQITDDITDIVKAGEETITETITTTETVKTDDKFIDKINKIVGYMFEIPKILIGGYVKLGDELHKNYDVPRWAYLGGSIYLVWKTIKKNR